MIAEEADDLERLIEAREAASPGFEARVAAIVAAREHARTSTHRSRGKRPSARERKLNRQRQMQAARKAIDTTS